MIQIYFSKRVMPKNIEFITDVNVYFDAKLANGDIKLDSTDAKLLQVIDHSSLFTDGFMDTPFSSHVYVTFASSGAKTLILAHHFAKNAILDISECGTNAVNILFSMDGNNYYSKIQVRPQQLKYPVRFNNRKNICKNREEFLNTWREWNHE